MIRTDGIVPSSASVLRMLLRAFLPSPVWAWSVAQVLGAERHAAQRGCQHAHKARRSRGSLACIDCGATFVETGL